MAQLYYSPISINAAQVPSTQTDFPVLVSVTDARFKTVGNGGHVQNSSGFDIRPYSDGTLATPLTGYYLHRYTPTTGEVIMRVKVNSLSSSTTPFVLGYGDTGITTDGSSTTCFSNNYLGFYPLGDGTTLNVNSTTGSNNGTNHSATATTGQVNGGAGFVTVSTQYIDLGTAIKPIAATFAVWVKGTTFPNAYGTLISRSDGAFDFFNLAVKSTGKLACYAGRNSTSHSNYDGTGSHTLSTGTWYYICMSFANGAGLVGYVNAASDGTSTGGYDLLNSGTPPTTIGKDAGSAGGYWNGVMDEARIASVARSADWITTEYNNEVAPGTFETLGSEVAITASNTGNMFLLFP